MFAAFDTELVDYILNQNRNSKLYETEYVDPSGASISFPEEKRNLIYIMLESMETSYLSKEQGGALEDNLIPELYNLASDNICFSDSARDVGGNFPYAGYRYSHAYYFFGRPRFSLFNRSDAFRYSCGDSCDQWRSQCGVLLMLLPSLLRQLLRFSNKQLLSKAFCAKLANQCQASRCE